MLLLKQVICTLLLAGPCLGAPGIPWSEDLVKKVHTKIDYLLANGIEITKRFDLYPNRSNTNEEYTRYVYDPTDITIEERCNMTDDQCNVSWSPEVRDEDIAFSSRKLLRLAFHDCLPYANPGDGNACDGCLNLDDHLDDHNGLQYTIAVLVSLTE